MSRKKRHHYLPKFYLKGFTNPLLRKQIIYIYEKGNPIIRKSSPVNAAVIKGYYSLDSDKSNIDSETIEKTISLIETTSVPIIKKINIKKDLTHEEKELFSIFLSCMFTRVPTFRNWTEKVTAIALKTWLKFIASNEKTLSRFINQLIIEKNINFDYSIEKLQNFLLDDNKYEICVSPQLSLDFLLLGLKLAPIFSKMNWAFLEATENYKFLTSDNPVYYIDPTVSSHKNVGLLNKNVIVFFPISKELILYASWKNFSGYKRSTNKEIKGINKNTIIFANRFIFSPQLSNGINKIVQKYKM